MRPIQAARAACLACALCWGGVAGAEVPIPPLAGRVTDQTATLTAEQKAALEGTLQAFEARKGSQLALLMLPTTAPETIEQYAVRVAEHWKLGRTKVDDGAVLVVAKNDRALRLEVGYGLEGALTDAASKRIISEIITPRFSQGDFYGGLASGIDQIIRVIDGEPLPEPPGRRGGEPVGSQQYLPVLLVLAVVLGVVLRTVFGRFPGALATGGVVAGVAWFFAGAVSLALLAGVLAGVFTLVGGGMGGLVLGGRRGGFGGGGFGGGGFSGGGGGFGGGGASGRW